VQGRQSGENVHLAWDSKDTRGEAFGEVVVLVIVSYCKLSESCLPQEHSKEEQRADRSICVSAICIRIFGFFAEKGQSVAKKVSFAGEAAVSKANSKIPESHLPQFYFLNAVDRSSIEWRIIRIQTKKKCTSCACQLMPLFLSKVLDNLESSPTTQSSPIGMHDLRSITYDFTQWQGRFRYFLGIMDLRMLSLSDEEILRHQAILDQEESNIRQGIQVRKQWGGFCFAFQNNFAFFCFVEKTTSFELQENGSQTSCCA
jgi:hypothetical protein